MTLRDTLKDTDYFASYLADGRRRIEKNLKWLAETDADLTRRVGISSSVFDCAMDMACAAYSAGQSKEEVRPLVIETFEHLARVNDLLSQDENELAGRAGGFDTWYRLQGWSILFDLSRQQTDILVDHIDLKYSVPRIDRGLLVERFFEAMGYKGREPAEKLLWPSAYEPLWQCFSKRSDLRPAQLEGFIKGWYKQMGRDGAYWHNRHKNKHAIYCGYWCFEAAAVAKILDIDDSALKDHPHYPYDARHG